jgi:ABC-2 type transport system ATP-binding protein
LNAIEAERLTKKFDGVAADDAISFVVRPGETYGLLGPNGAGKTTLVRMLTTLLHPTSGVARVAGYDIVREKEKVRASIGTVSQAETTDENLTVRENLSVHGKMYGMWGRRLSEMIERRLTQVGLWEKRHQITKTLSGGMRRRLEIARGVLHSPHILFLDEPTTGLDPQSRRAVWEMLGELKSLDRSLAVVLTTHAMEEANFLCDRLAIMDRGRILCEDSPESLKRSLPTGERVELETDRPIEPVDRDSILAIGAVNWRASSDTSVQFEARPGQGVGRLAVQIVEERGYRILHLSIAPVTLEDVFFAYTGRALRDAE